jgi:hypothetical protein
MLVRIVVGFALCLALAACAVLSVPGDLPAIALGQPSIYRLEVALSVFYACLLIVTPAYSGLIAGRLPDEISTRGARFAEEADRSVAQQAAITGELRQTTSRLGEELEKVTIELARLKASRDKT